MLTKAPKGTKDILPENIYKWQYVENLIREICKNYNFYEMRTPVFEHTELFERGVGNTSDVVQKEMYTFLDKGNRSITLRPEITASTARAFLENNLYAGVLPAKLYYMGSCYRYEKPQSGRLREFHQFGVECFGTKEASIDAEIISLAKTVMDSLNIKDVELNINSIGCPECRKKYNTVLRNYIKTVEDKLCDTCRERADKNPLRIFDCKSPVCREAMGDAPLLFDYICDDCKDHFNKVTAYLNNMGIEYKIDKKIVRGLDYYTKTVFEFVSSTIGAQGTVCGGGRYDGLIEEIGGGNIPGIGFGMGIERLLLTMESQSIELPNNINRDLFIATIGDNAKSFASGLIYKLRGKGISCDIDHMGKGLKAQMKYADKQGFKYTLCIGDDEISGSNIRVKNMTNGEIIETTFDKLSNIIKEGK